MYIKTVFTNNESPLTAVDELKKQLDGFSFDYLFFFASYAYDAKLVAECLNESFSDKVLIGCSSLSEFYDNREEKKSITAMAISKECIEDIKVEILHNVSKEIKVREAFENFENHYNIKMSDANYKEYVGLMLADGLSNAEERIIEAVGDLTNVFFVGGSAADNLSFNATYVYANGEAYQDACILALLKMKTEFAIVKTQSVNKTETSFTVTKATPELRLINEINDRPAAQYLSEIFDAPIDQLDDLFFNCPVGLVVGEDIFIRSLKNVQPDGSVSTFCSVAEGLDLSLLNIKDMAEDTKNCLIQKEKELGQISGIINFNCAFRTLQLYNQNNMDNFCQVFTGYPTIGFSTYGEIYLGHINQTATMLVFK